ncbi:uncharacterized protein LOC141680106 [Apium graveolens]|uniref:uncharacterized protein LOC141680106 n=1 Tax=Apium graveolens TaxID=4045 RepID=UPI003D7AE916
MGRLKKKARIADDDRISKLPDDLIHRIMSFLDIQQAGQTSVLSKRWKPVWTTLPYLRFNGCLNHKKHTNYCKFLDEVFYGRKHRSGIITLELWARKFRLDLRKMKKYVKYAISRKVERINFKTLRCCSLSLFKSESLKQLKLKMKFEYNKLMKSVCWNLPNLTTLHLKSCQKYSNTIRQFPESCLMCLPALTTLGLDHLELPESLCLPSLTSLRLKSCTLPRKVWDFPALLTLELLDVFFPENISDYFLALTGLRNLTVDFRLRSLGCCVISSYGLLTLTIKVSKYNTDRARGRVVVLAPKLCNFNAIGFFRTRFEGSMLENVYIKYWQYKNYREQELKEHLNLLKVMFAQLGSTKTLTLDLVTLKALFEISDVLVHLRCPFYNLKYLKLPYGCDESILSKPLRQYILSGSPLATIVKTLSQEFYCKTMHNSCSLLVFLRLTVALWVTTEDLIFMMTPAVSIISQNVVLEECLATSTTEPKMRDDTFDMRVTKENVVENSEYRAEKVKALASGESNDRASTSLEKSCFVLWQGHEVNTEYADLLDLIMKRYPETFKHKIIKNHKIWTVKLNMLCSFVNAFTKTSMTEVNSEMLTEYRGLIYVLQKSGFNIDWLMSHLNYIESLYELYASDPHIDNAKEKLQDLQTLHARKISAAESFWTQGISLAAIAHNIGDGLL